MEQYHEIIGYVGSVLVAVSLSMKNIRLLRQINFLGAFAFSLYGFLIGAMPVFILNGYIAVIDIYYLYKIYKTKEDFNIIPASEKEHDYLKLFLDFYIKDILKFFPGFKRKEIKNLKCYFMLRNLRPVGLLAFEEISESKIKIHLDYVIPDYRDLKTGKYLYNKESEYFKSNGYKEIITDSDVPKHIKYLKNIGFKKLAEGNSTYVKNI